MRLSTMVLVCTAAAVSFTGCAKQAKNETPQPTTKVVAVPQFAMPAVDAIGGRAAWNNTQAITGDCTVNVFSSGEPAYLTQQRHAIYPWSDTVRIMDSEPQGRFLWQLYREDYRLMEGSRSQAQLLPGVLTDRTTAEAIWNLMAVPARLATVVDPNAKPGELTRIDGIWYFPISLAKGQVYLQNSSTHVIDACLILQGTGFVLVRGYSYQTIPSTLISVPHKIEIFTADKHGMATSRLAEFNYSILKSFSFAQRPAH